MFKKTITYKDWNGVERTEEFRFHLSRTELELLNARTPGGLFNYMKSCYDAMDIPKMTDFFVNLILKSYGEVSQDGRRFMKKDAEGNDLAEAFAETPAFDVIFQWLYNEKGAIKEFMVGTFPEDVRQTIIEAFEDNPVLSAEK